MTTSNKALVAAKGAELIALAKEKNVNFMFEASVGGGIPIIRPLNSCLTADEIEEITGIINGTTNYMLTKMSEEGLEFDAVLREAQEKGYAEKTRQRISRAMTPAENCDSDLSGVRTAGGFRGYPYRGNHKNHCGRYEVCKNVGRAIKLLATSKKTEEGYTAMVAPFLLPPEHPLYSVNGVFNAIFVHGNVLGDAMFYGSGAGKLPTASAVVADVVEMAKIPIKIFRWSGVRKS